MVETITREVYSEVYAFIELIGNEYKKKIPNEIYEIIEKQKLPEQKKVYDINKPIAQQITKKETLAFIAYLDLNYWCDEKEREAINSIFNQKEIEEEIKKQQKYGTDVLFKKSNNKQEENFEKNEKSLIVYKKNNFFKIIINAIKSFFKKDER